MTAAEALPGLDLSRFAAWFRRSCPGEATGPLRGRLLAGGRSNLTYEVGDGHRRWVVRRPPLGHVLPTAHDMAREHRVITALRDTAVPVPRTYGMCTDEHVIGAPFYVMQHVDGTALHLAEQLTARGPDRTRMIALRMVDTLAALHEVDPDRVGLGDFGRPKGFLARQVRRWRRQLDASRSRALAGIDALADGLTVAPPDGAPAAVVHGDYRLDNLLVDTKDRITAVVDWEMATLGDPLTDVGLFVVYQRLPVFVDGDGVAAVANPGAAAGYPEEAELLQWYTTRSGRDLSNLGFRVALAAFKLAVILEGIHYRHRMGKTVGAGFENVGALVEPIVEVGRMALREH